MKLKKNDWDKLILFLKREFDNTVNGVKYREISAKNFLLFNRYNIVFKNGMWHVFSNGVKRAILSKTSIAVAWVIFHKSGRLDICQKLEFHDTMAVAKTFRSAAAANALSEAKHERLSKYEYDRMTSMREIDKYIGIAKYWQIRGII